MTDLHRVLVVEDEMLILLDLMDNLVDHGLEVLPLYTTEGALTALRHANIDALITDIELPGPINGLQLARQAARLRPGLPIVVMSGGVHPTPGELPSGAAFIAKPCSVDRIIAALHSQITAHAA